MEEVHKFHPAVQGKDGLGQGKGCDLALVLAHAVYGGAAGIWMLYHYLQAFFLVEAKLQGGVIAGKLGLGGPLWSEHNGILSLTLGKEREG